MATSSSAKEQEKGRNEKRLSTTKEASKRTKEVHPDTQKMNTTLVMRKTVQGKIIVNQKKLNAQEMGYVPLTKGNACNRKRLGLGKGHEHLSLERAEKPGN